MGEYRILIGDITSDDILKGHDLIVNPTAPVMVAGAGISGAIYKKAGIDELENYTQKEFDINYFDDNYNPNNIMKVGDIRITPGFNLGMDILFIQGPQIWDSEKSMQMLIEIYNKLFMYIKESKYKNILLPSLGTGHYGFHHKDIGEILSKMIKEFIKNNNINIDLVLYDGFDKQYYE